MFVVLFRWPERVGRTNTTVSVPKAVGPWDWLGPVCSGVGKGPKALRFPAGLVNPGGFGAGRNRNGCFSRLIPWATLARIDQDGGNSRAGPFQVKTNGNSRGADQGTNKAAFSTKTGQGLGQEKAQLSQFPGPISFLGTHPRTESTLSGLDKGPGARFLGAKRFLGQPTFSGPDLLNQTRTGFRPGQGPRRWSFNHNWTNQRHFPFFPVLS